MGSKLPIFNIQGEEHMQAYSKYTFRDLRSHIGRNIQKLRTERRISLHRLENRTGIPAQLLDYYELGKSEVSLQALLKIACALRAEIIELIK